VYALLSNNYINDILMHDYDFNDDEVVANYMSLVKGLSVCLNATTIQFYLGQDTCPLFDQAVKFYDYPEQMVKIASRASVLSLMKIPDELMAKTIIKSKFFERYVSLIKNSWVKLD